MQFVKKLRVYGAIIAPLKIFQFCDMLNENRFLGIFSCHGKRPSLSAKSSSVNERLKTIHELVFHVKIYTKLKPIECRITYVLYIFYNVIVL